MSKKVKMEDDISKDKAQAAAEGAFSRALRRCNIRMLMISIVMLIILCAVMLARIHALNETIKNMNTQLEGLARLANEQQEQLRQLTEELQDAQEGNSMAEGGNSAGGQMQGKDSGTDAKDSVPEITAAHKVYLTFDDGPSTNTRDILDILDEYGVKATFFVVGKDSESARESMKQIVEAGHTLGMHSYSHKYSELYASVEDFAEDFAKLQEYIYEVTGVKSMVYRFPGGSSNTVSKIDMKEFAKYLDSQGVRFFDWNISSGDGGSYLYPAETLVEHCTENISRYSTSVILMHDSAGKMTTVEALPTIIEKILEMEDTVILPITDETTPIQHISWQEDE